MDVEQDLGKLARYPFLDDAKAYVASLGLSLSELFDHPVYSGCIEAGRKRLIDCRQDAFKPESGDRLTNQLTILSYPVARILAASIGNRYVTQRYARGEAQTVYKLLSSENPETIKEIISDLGIESTDQKMPLTQYLKLVRFIAKENPRFHLVNRIVHAGYVEVNRDDFRLLIREAVMNRVLEPVATSKIPAKLKEMAVKLRASLTGERHVANVSSIDDKALPECIKKMMGLLEDGAATHNAMFILATFFLNLGLGTEDVLNILKKSPKYNEEVARYQLEFLSGDKGGTEYTCPTCETIKSYGLGCSECTFKHPLQRYRMNVKARKYKIRHERLKNKPGQ
ncbi:hypothetical protein ACFLRF_02810 [Candidatus Altiarchaeota archaeon]